MIRSCKNREVQSVTDVKKTRKNKLFLYFGLLLVFLSGTIYLTDNLKQFQLPTLILGLLVLLFVSLNKGISMPRIKYFFVHLLLAFVCVCSSIALADIKVLLFGLALLLLYFVFETSVSFSSDKDLVQMFPLFTVMFVAFIVASVAIGGFSFRGYKGFFYNQNSFGGTCCFFFTFYLICFLSKKRQFVSFILLFVLFFLIVISSSRASLLCSVSLIALVFLLKIFQSKHKFKILIALFVLFLTAFFIYRFTFLGTVFENSIINKFILKESNETSGRIDIWVRTIQETSFVGHGSDYYSTFRFGPHNTLISILGQYGLIALILFVVLFVFAFYDSVLIAVKKKDFGPLIIVSSFFVLSMFEGMMMKSNMFLLYVVIANMEKYKNSSVFSFSNNENAFLRCRCETL